MASCGAADSDGGGGFPTLRTAANTGLTGAVGGYPGSYLLNAPNTVTENFILDDRVRINAVNQTIRNCQFILPPGDGAQNDYNLTNVDFLDGGNHAGLIVEDCEFIGASSAHVLMSSGTFRRCHFHDSGSDSIKIQGTNLEGATFEDCFFELLANHDYTSQDGSTHSDGIQMRRDAGGQTTFKGCNFDLHPALAAAGYDAANAIAIIQTGDGTITGTITFEECYFGGGTFMFRFTDPGGFGGPQDWSLINNIWRPFEWQFGPIDYVVPPTLVSGNRRIDTGANVDQLIINQSSAW